MANLVYPQQPTSISSTFPKRIGVLTSGGDAPGMNAAIRAVVRASIYYGRSCVGIYQGYRGMVQGDMEALSLRSVSNIIHQGGTILKSARSQEFMTQQGRERGYQHLRDHQVDALIAIGGDGTFKGAIKFADECGLPIIGVPATIDNDLYGTDYAIGYDTATNTAVDAIDKIRDTASSHNRLFFVEVMGRDAGFIALKAGMGAGAEAILVPERETSFEDLVAILESGAESQKSSSLVVVAEGGREGRTFDIAREVEKRFSYYNTRVTILGHLQRGGRPSCHDRIVASQLGVGAVEALLEGRSGEMVCYCNGNISGTPLREAVEKRPTHNEDELLRIAQILSI
jgi:6-phosphofructokinase 1